MAAERQRMRFRDRADAGRALGERLGEFRRRPGAIVLALPRGGVPIGYEVAAALELPLDVFTVRKLGVPGREELAMGAIATGGMQVVDRRLAAALEIDDATIARVVAEETRRLAERERRYRRGRPPPPVSGRSVILVDDGLATGSTMRAAVKAIRSERPATAVVAAPVAPRETCASLAEEADQVVCAVMPEPFYAVGAWYDDFEQVSDDQVCELLDRARDELGPAGAREHPREPSPIVEGHIRERGG